MLRYGRLFRSKQVEQTSVLPPAAVHGLQCRVCQLKPKLVDMTTAALSTGESTIDRSQLTAARNPKSSCDVSFYLTSFTRDDTELLHSAVVKVRATKTSSNPLKKSYKQSRPAWDFQAAPSLISCTDFYAQRISAILKQRFPLQSPQEVEERTKNRSQTRKVKDMKKSQQLSGSSCNPKNHDRQAQLVRDNNITTNGFTFPAPASSSSKDQKNENQKIKE